MAQGTGIDAEEPGELRLRDTSLPAEGEESLAKGRSTGPGHAAEEPNDPRQETERRPRRDARLTSR